MGGAGEQGDFGNRGSYHLAFLGDNDKLFFLEVADDDACADNLTGLRCYLRRFDARAAATLNLVFRNFCALAVSLAHNDEERGVLCLKERYDFCRHDTVALPYTHAAHAACRTTHLAHILCFKANALPFSGYDRHRVALSCEMGRDEPVARLKSNGDDARTSHIGKRFRRDTLHRAHFGHKDDRGCITSGPLRHGEHTRHRLFGGERKKVHNALPLCRALAFWNLIHLKLVRFAEVGEEEEVAVRMCDEEVRHDIFFLGRDIHHADTAAFLFLVFARVRPLHISALREQEHGFFVRHKIFCRNVLHTALHYLCAAVVTILLAELRQLSLHHSENLLRR